MRMINSKNRFFISILFFLLIYSAFQLTSCSSVSNEVNYSDMIMGKVVEIKICNSDDNIIGYATGTVVSKDGYILTNRHVVRYYNNENQTYELYSNLYYRFYDEKDYSKAVIKEVSDEYDLALLESNISTNNYFSLSSCSPKMSEQVHTIGNSNGFGLAYSRGYISIDKIYVFYENKNSIYINVSIPINEGNSGGPLVSNYGELYGIITFRLKNKNGEIITNNCYCIPIDDIIDFIGNIS